MKEDINKALEVLKSGGIILYPTDTIWGLGCDATNEKAVQKIYSIKKRDAQKSMLILLENPASIYAYVERVPDIAFDIMELSEKPVSVIFPGAKNLAPNLPAEDGSIGIRLTQETFTKQLIQRFRKPIVSTSANHSNEKTPLNFAQISDRIKEKADYVVKYKQDCTTSAQSSSIIKIGLSNEVEIIRK